MKTLVFFVTVNKSKYVDCKKLKIKKNQQKLNH